MDRLVVVTWSITYIKAAETFWKDIHKTFLDQKLSAWWIKRPRLGRQSLIYKLKAINISIELAFLFIINLLLWPDCNSGQPDLVLVDLLGEMLNVNRQPYLHAARSCN